ncbi:hypothetical protein Nepgr_015756 [Nepenthes gracilis]|uniref:Uncharacterized protein n=1 Tax=Nepenthes gracilis TaxID=150966 RepID=A0AAD3SNF0_NEPGR|nr:hypothetical protein Nepgr_015756 [Nepenthes gracilis]
MDIIGDLDRDSQKDFVVRADGILIFRKHLCTPDDKDLKEEIMKEARRIRTPRNHDAIWVIVDRLMKSAHFLAIWMTSSSGAIVHQ